MGLFSTILEKLGIKKTADASAASTPASKPAGAAPVPPQGAVPAGFHPAPGGPMTPPPGMPAGGPGVPPPGIPLVDVVSKLDGLAKMNPEKLDWKVSIVDMLKLLGMDSSLNARKIMATELGCPENLIGGDYSQMNIWLHKTVLQKIAENGGNIPAALIK